MERKKQSIDICDEILVHILSRLPRKTLCRFKCVSKPWLDLISDPKTVIPRRSVTGLILQCSRLCNDPFFSTFLSLDNRGGGAASSIFLHPTKRIKDSCKGFLLLKEKRTSSKRDVSNRYFVYNPITGHLKPEVISMGTLHSTCIGLVMDDDGKNFKVISVYVNHSCIQFCVFSSEERRYIVLKPFGPSSLSAYIMPPAHDLFPKHATSLFFKGAIHWPLPEHILVFHLQFMFGKLISLPFSNWPTTISRTKREQCIWEFEGSLHYSQVSYSSRIEIWVLLMEEENYVVVDKQIFKWQLKRNIILSLPNSVPHHLSTLSPFAFDGDFQILYLRCHAVVISYDLVTGKQEEVHACPWEGRARSNPFIRFAGYPFPYNTD